MTSKERILLALDHKEADRIAIYDKPWPTTIRRWYKEGLPEYMEASEYFNYELEGITADTSFQLHEKTIEKTVEYIITQDSFGAIKKNLRGKTSTPECIDFLIKDRKTWEEYKPKLSMNKTRFNWINIKEAYDRCNNNGKFLFLGCVSGYDKLQTIIGSERLLIALVEEPEWIKDMMAVFTELIVNVSEEIYSKFKFDGMFFFDDMGYKNSSLFSPATYKEIFFPYHKRMWTSFKEKGVPIIMHSCGCVKGLIPMFIEAGLTCLQPLEVKAGMDLIELKKMYGEKLSFMGGIDVRKMKDSDPNVIEEEIKTKISFAKQGGGYIYHSDHSVPDDVSFSQYSRVIELVKKYGSF